MAELYRLYRLKSYLDKVVVVRDIENGQVTILHVPPLSSDICWLVPVTQNIPKRICHDLSNLFLEIFLPHPV